MKLQYCVLSLVCALPGVSVAGDVLLGISGSKIGDLGESYGVEAAYRFHPTVRARVGYSGFDYQQSRTLSLFSATQTLEQKNPRLTVDWFPWQSRNGLYASAGVTKLSDPAKISANLTANSIDITRANGSVVRYSNANLGTVSGTVETKQTVPYVGVGYVHHFSPPDRNGWYVQLEAGQISGLDPKLKLTTTNPSNLGNLPADLQEYADQQNKLFEDSYTVYGLTMGYRF